MFIELHQVKDGLPICVNSSHIQCFASGGDMCSCIYFDSEVRIEVQESYDEIKAILGDYIIKGVHGELYPIQNEIFEETYEVLQK